MCQSARRDLLAMLKLVSDNHDPEGPDYANIAEMLRQYAGELEKGVYGEVLCAVLVLETPRMPMVLGCGEDPTPFELMGLFEACKLNVFADHATADEA